MESRVNQLEIQMGAVLTRLKPLEEWIPESRRFHDSMNNFKADLLARQDAEREHHDRQHEQNSIKMNWIMAFAALGTMILTGLAILVSIEIARHQTMNIPDFLHSQNQLQQEAHETALPPTYQMR